MCVSRSTGCPIARHTTKRELTTAEVRVVQIDLGDLPACRSPSKHNNALQHALHGGSCTSARVVVRLQRVPTALVPTPVGEIGGISKLRQNLPLLELQSEQTCA